jgi:hypothetical protein
LSVAVIVTPPATTSPVNVMVAMPDAFVAEVGFAKDPFAPARVHVTTRPPSATGALFASVSCAVIVTDVPTVGAELLDVTAYFAAGPGTRSID